MVFLLFILSLLSRHIAGSSSVAAAVERVCHRILFCHSLLISITTWLSFDLPFFYQFSTFSANAYPNGLF